MLLLACLFICGTVSCGPSYSQVTGLPFCAVQITEVTESTGKSTFRAKVCRDSEGRTRFENLGTPEEGGTPNSVRIDDPMTGMTYILFPSGKLAHQRGPWRAFPPGPFRRSPSPLFDRRSQDLGTKMLDGFEAAGRQITPAGWTGAPGHTPPPGTGTTEEWYSPELSLVILMVDESSPSYKRVVHLTEIVRGEQPAELFRVPAGYTVHALPIPHPGRT